MSEVSGTAAIMATIIGHLMILLLRKRHGDLIQDMGSAKAASYRLMF